MRLLLSGEAARENAAEITKRAAQVSQILFDTAQQLDVDPAVHVDIPYAIRDVAQEFSAIAQLCIDLQKLLGKERISRDNTDAGKILSRLDLLLHEFEKQLNDFTTSEPDRVREWFGDMFWGIDVADVMVKCKSVKEPLRLHVSVLRVAQTRRSSRKAYEIRLRYLVVG